ncbi:MAG TPA: hypothetical protein VM580_33050 [Labilithrix sp.]|jgi:hypothetical protein|nr:hypothetical protein [Labilithrix sp.]
MAHPSDSLETTPYPEPVQRSRWRFLLPIVWVALCARILVALSRGEPLKNDFLSLALIAFFMTTALLGSRVWLWIRDHSSRFAPSASSNQSLKPTVRPPVPQTAVPERG